MTGNPFSDLEVRSTPTRRNPHSAKQESFIRSLAEDRDTSQLVGTDALYLRLLLGGEVIDRRDASNVIDALKRLPRKATANTTEPPEGVHLKDDVVYKVQVAHHGSGKKYAKKLNLDTGEFEYVGRGPLRNLSDDSLMTITQAQEFGHLYGMCVRCGATLTDEGSIEAGIGPVCASKF